MRKRHAALLLAALAPAAWAASCADPPEVHIDPTGTGGGFVGDAGKLDAAGGDGGAPPPGDGGPSAPVRVALSSIPPSGQLVGPGSFEAELAALALGARAVVLEQSFREVCDPSGAPDPDALASLAALVEGHAAAGRQAYVELAAARRGRDLRPDALASLPWDDATVAAAWVAAAEELLTLAPNVAAIGLGSSVDVLLEAKPAFATFALTARGELSGLPAPPKVALGFRASALTSDAMPDQPQSRALLLASSFDLVRVTYLPGVDAATSSPLELGDALFAALPDRVFLLEAGTAGGTPTEQALFHSTLRALVTSHRASFPLVLLVHRRELASGGCSTYAAWSGLDPASDAALALCASGVVDASGADKPALPEVLATLATLASP